MPEKALLHSFLWLSYIPLYINIKFTFLSIHQWTLCLLPCLSYFNSAAVNVKVGGACVFLNYIFLAYSVWECGLLDHAVALYFQFLNEPLFHHGCYSFYICLRGFPFSMHSPTFTVCRLLDAGHSDSFQR